MSQLSITLIDVGWGDSIFIDSIDSNNNRSFALIDSNDTVYYRSSFIFIKRFFEKVLPDTHIPKPAFRFVILSHAHADHGQGLKSIIREFGTQYFWYPKSLNLSALKELINYANRSTTISHHQSIDQTKAIPDLGDVIIKVLWPPYNVIDNHNENNNSIVLTLTLGNVSFVLTGDAEADVWSQISNKIPSNTRLFKVPHHGSVNGTFDNRNQSPWLNNCPSNSVLAISAHNRPFGHPDQEVVNLLNNQPRKYFRTDEHYHLTFTTDGNDIQVKYSHI